MGIPVEYPPRGRAVPARDRHALRLALDMADHTITYRLVVKEMAQKHGATPRSCRSRSSARTARACTRTSRCSRRAQRVFDEDDEWHLSDAGKAFIAGQLRHAREISAVFAQWVNSYKRLVRATRRRSTSPGRGGTARRSSHPALQPGPGAGDPGRDPLPRSRLQPLPDLRGPAPRGSRGDREGLRAARADGAEPLPPDGRAAEGARDRVAPETLGEAIDELASHELARKALGGTSSSATSS